MQNTLDKWKKKTEVYDAITETYFFMNQPFCILYLYKCTASLFYSSYYENTIMFA